MMVYHWASGRSASSRVPKTLILKMKREREGSLTVLLLDASGSMAGREEEIVAAVNTFPPSTVCYTFNSVRVPFNLPLQVYVPDGKTHLYDAICDTIAELKPDTLIVATDGHDDTSERHTLAQAKEALKSVQCIFLAEGLDASQTGADLGLTVDNGELSASLRAYSQAM